MAPIPDELMGRACADHNERHLVAVSLKDKGGGVGIICECGRGGDRAQRVAPYLDPRLEQLWLVDQESQECTVMGDRLKGSDLSAEFAGIDVELAKPFKHALELELESYVAQHFPKPTSGPLQGCEGAAGAAVYSFRGKDSGDDVDLRVLLSSRRARPRGHWSGTWGSQWRIVFVPEQKDPALLGGDIDFATHYAEDANVHFRRKIARKAEIHETADPTKWAREVVQAITRIEDEFHGATEDFCSGLGAGGLKSLRRVLPLSKERFDWRPIRHALVRDMKNVENKGER